MLTLKLPDNLEVRSPRYLVLEVCQQGFTTPHIVLRFGWCEFQAFKMLLRAYNERLRLDLADHTLYALRGEIRIGDEGFDQLIDIVGKAGKTEKENGMLKLKESDIKIILGMMTQDN